MRKLFLGVILIYQVSLAQQPELVLPIGHTGEVESALFSPDGAKVLTRASWETAAILWDTRTGKMLKRLIGHTYEIWSFAFSFDGSLIATASIDSTVIVWDALTGYPLLKLKGHKGIVSSVVFSPDGKRIATGSWDGTARIWDSGNGNLVYELKGHSGRVTNVIFSPGSKMIVTGSSDGTAIIWDSKTGNRMQQLRGHRSEITSLAFSPDGSQLITASMEGKVLVWQLQIDNKALDLIGHQGEVYSATFSPDGKKILTASADSTSKLWDAKSGSLIHDLKDHTGEVKWASFSTDGSKIVTACSDKIARIWDSGSGLLLKELNGHINTVNSAFFSPDGTLVATSGDQTARLWEVKTGSLQRELKGQSEGINVAVYSPDGTKVALVTGSNYLYNSIPDFSNENSPGMKDIPSDRFIRVWDAETWKLLLDLKGHTAEVTSVLFSPDNQRLLTASMDGTSRIWDAKSGELLKELKGHKQGIITAVFSPDGKKIVTASMDGTAIIWDSKTGARVKDLNSHARMLFSAVFSPDGKKIATASSDDSVRIWNAVSGILLKSFHGELHPTRADVFSSDGHYFISILDSTVNIWNLQTWKIDGKLRVHHGISNAFFSPDNKIIVTTDNWDGEIGLWDPQTGRRKTYFNTYPGGIYYAAFSSDGKQIALTASRDSTAGIWKIPTGKSLTDLRGHSGLVSAVNFSPVGNDLMTISMDNALKIWDKNTGKLKFTFYQLENSGYFGITPSGYFQANKEGAKILHYVTQNLKIISFEQLDIKYNRPDKVLEGIGNKDTNLIKSYRNAWEKRIKKLGIDTTKFRNGYNIPEADFANREQIVYEQKQDSLLLHISGNDSSYYLDRYNIWVNEVPIFGQRGVSLKNMNTHHIDEWVSVKLSDGENRLETSVINVNGSESFRMPLLVHYTPVVETKEKVYFIGIGIDRYFDSVHNLRYSVKDIRDLSVAMKAKFGAKLVTDTLMNERVTTGNIKDFKSDLLNTTVNDKVIIAYSGHGLLSDSLDYYLSTYNVNFKKPEQNGLPYDELENLLDSIPARKKLMLIDACHSGELDKEEKLEMDSIALSHGLKSGELNPVIPAHKKHLGFMNSFELMQALFVNVGKTTGATIIAAAAGNQYALEGGGHENGIFTFYLLETMRENETIRIKELQNQITLKVEQFMHGLQRPTSRSETVYEDWEVWPN
jgi:WD40 repeat protein